MIRRLTIMALLACFITLIGAQNALAVRPNAGDTITNIVTADYEDALGNAMDQVSAQVDITVLQVYGVDVAPATDAKSGCNDADVVYQFTVTNTGNGDDTFDLSAAHQSGWVPAGVTFYSNAALTIPITDTGVLASGATSGTIYAKLTVPSSTPGDAGTTGVEWLTATSQGDTNVPAANDYQEVTTTILAADLSTSTKDTNPTSIPTIQQYTVGATVTYEITVTNSGNYDATNVVVTDTIPAILENLTTSHGSFAGNVLTYNHGTLAIGASVTITVTGDVMAGTPDGTVTNTANIDYDSCLTTMTPETPSVDIQIVSADLSTSTKEADATNYEAGDTVTYTITLRNSSTTLEATNVVVTDTIPAELTNLTSSVGGFVGNDFTYNHGTLAPSATFVITITGDVVGGLKVQTLVTNTASIVYDSGTEPKGPVTPSVDITIDVPILTVNKVADTATAAPGDTITYTITVSNTGGADARSVVITDTLSGFVTFAGFGPTPAVNCAPSELAGVISGNPTGGIIPAGGSMSFEYQVTVDTTP